MPVMAGANELTADTVAVEPTILHQIMQLLLSGLAVLLGWLVKNAIPMLNAWLKERMHFRGSGAVADAMTEALTHLATDVQQRIATGKWTSNDLKELKAEAQKIAKDKLERLGGFYKADLTKWIDEQLDTAMGKLLLLVGGSRKAD